MFLALASTVLERAADIPTPYWQPRAAARAGAGALADRNLSPGT
ncbi:MAG: hypothetical protein ACM31C_31990 [Acidobacteriota bacterium]